MPNKTYSNVQMKIDFATQVGDGAGRLSDAMLYSNISKNASDKPSGASSFVDPHNLAVTLAKLYTWSNDIFTFNPSGTKKIVIKDGIAKDTTYSFATGTTAGAFEVTPLGASQPTTVSIYKGLNAENTKLATGTAVDVIKLQWKNGNTWTDINSITLGLLDSGGKIKDTLLPSYVDDVVEGYYYNDKFYEEAAHTHEITAESGKIYVDLATNDSYRWGGTTYVKISSPTDIFSGATASTAGTAGLVPAPAAGDEGKFLCGDGSWAVVNTADEKVKNTYASNKVYYPAGMTGTSTTTGGQYADTAFKYSGTTGTTSAIGEAELQLGNATASGTNGNKQGSLVIYGTTAYSHTIKADSGKPTANRTLTLPDNDGTFALTSDIKNGKLSIKGGTTTVTEFTANQSTDISFAIVAGTNISVTPDTTNHKVTIANTYTYTHPTYTARTGKPGNDVSIDFDQSASFTLSQVKSDTTGHVTDMVDRTISFSLPSDIPRIPASGSRNNKYLRDDGTWQDPMAEYTTLILNCTYDTSVT